MSARSEFRAAAAADRVPGAYARADLARIHANVVRNSERQAQLLQAYRERRQPRGILVRLVDLFR